MTDTFTITYRFTLSNDAEEVFDLEFDTQTVELVKPPRTELPFWTELEYRQCPHCPLKTETCSHCPVAVNLIVAIERFDRLMSFERVRVEVISCERRVVRPTSAQEGISSLMGLLIAGSSCPYTHFFKPMARFHLPFANKNETLWRAASTYLLTRYFAGKGLDEADMNLDGLVEIYNDVAQLNDYMVERLRAATSKDSTVNALVHLDVFAKFLTPPLGDSLNQIRHIFEPFLGNGGAVPPSVECVCPPHGRKERS
jgi:hypothetical protein